MNQELANPDIKPETESKEEGLPFLKMPKDEFEQRLRESSEKSKDSPEDIFDLIREEFNWRREKWTAWYDQVNKIATGTFDDHCLAESNAVLTIKVWFGDPQYREYYAKDKFGVPIDEFSQDNKKLLDENQDVKLFEKIYEKTIDEISALHQKNNGQYNFDPIMAKLMEEDALGLYLEIRKRILPALLEKYAKE